MQRTKQKRNKIKFFSYKKNQTLKEIVLFLYHQYIFTSHKINIKTFGKLLKIEKISDLLQDVYIKLIFMIDKKFQRRCNVHWKSFHRVASDLQNEPAMNNIESIDNRFQSKAHNYMSLCMYWKQDTSYFFHMTNQKEMYHLQFEFHYVLK